MFFMHKYTGSVDTRENWREEFASQPIWEWHGYICEEDFNEHFEHDDLAMSWDFCLIEVERVGNEWVEV